MEVRKQQYYPGHYDSGPHEEQERQADWAEPRTCRVCSSHDPGGARMGDNPRSSVVDRNLQVHDTPGLYVFSGAVFPTCPAVNPTLTMWALCARACEELVLGE